MAKRGTRKQSAVEANETSMKGAVMEDGKKAQELFNEGSSKAVETITLWADANQRVLRELAELSAATGRRVCGCTRSCSRAESRRCATYRLRACTGSRAGRTLHAIRWPGTSVC